MTQFLYKETWSDSHLDLDYFTENKHTFQDQDLSLKLREKGCLKDC